MSEKEQILNIAMNLNRVGNWTADGYPARKKRIATFLEQTSGYLKSIETSSLPKPLKNSLTRFLKEYSRLEKEGLDGPRDELDWAEKMMTWGNILTHRASLIKT
ncbi:MAG: hypothetical protein A2Z24_02035 [Candidatus Woykebacteria bacterium RBG_16_44_10]|uniref:Uncharacterized protein n=1 Tax=Candidatus Woykebacteria bacterium RBG_16_44_10 TaxID=1802597 RepID=A0A1G1WEZ8_9BACT|nr:MAG: hypothetical protein A2Z24_02035 [Candidatus Woykebacteria bacterium RBG_16_44_10]